MFLHTASGGDYDAVMGEVAVAEVDNDAPALVVSETMVEVAEDAGEASWTVVLTTEPSGPVTVSVFTGDPTIATVTPVSLPFGPATWDIPQTVTVTAVNDFVLTATALLKSPIAPAAPTTPESPRSPFEVALD